MTDSRMRRAAQALRDPWSLLAAGVGAGAAWALALPIAGIGAVAVGMLGVAAAVGAATSDHGPGDNGQKSLQPGTPQFAAVGVLDSYLEDLTRLRKGQLPPTLTTMAADAVDAATAAKVVAVDVAGSVDALDLALREAGQVARQMSTSSRVSAPLGRMKRRRQELLAKLAVAVDGVGELYAKLLELSAAPELGPSLALAPGPDPVAEVNDSLDAIREAFAELGSASRQAAKSLDSPTAG